MDQPHRLPTSWGGTWITFNDVANDSSTVQYATFKYGSTGIALTSASPNINHVRFENDHYGVDLNGVSLPKIDFCTFHNLRFYPIQLSLVSFPSSFTNNVISGTTYKVLAVRNETLTQDVTLAKRSFGGINNIPYLFGDYIVGTGATLTINPGVVCKFNSGGSITVNKGLIAEGGFAADSNIVFTSIKDDFFGGDSNADSTLTVPAVGNWTHILFNDQALDPLSRLRHCIVKYSYYGINTTSASPLVTYSTISKNYYGAYASAASNPVFHYCDFDDNYYWSVNNVNKSFVIDATNCWWGSNLGPIQTNTQGNGTSTQELITTSVNYLPYKTSGATNPAMGDVSLNGTIQAYDASLVLQKVVGSITLNSTQTVVADVSGTAGITSYDASLILQYIVGIIQNFPAELLKSSSQVLVDPQLIVESGNVLSGQDISIPIKVTNCSEMLSSDITLKYNPVYLSVNNIQSLMPQMSFSYSNDSINGILKIALAGTEPLINDASLIQVNFHAVQQSVGTITTQVEAISFIANETDLTTNAVSGSITISDFATGIPDYAASFPGTMSPVYPNPVVGNSKFNYELNKDNVQVVVEVFDLLGQRMATLVNEVNNSGKYSVAVSKQGNSLANGTYLLKLSVDGISKTQVFQIVK